MRYLTLICLLGLFSCSHIQKTPDWATGLREGDSSLRVNYGSRIFYRRIAKSENGYSPDDLCRKAMTLAYSDIKKEFPSVGAIPHMVDYSFYDSKHNDCIVSISVASNISSRLGESVSNNLGNENEVSNSEVNYSSTVKIKKGMTEQQVISILGYPKSVEKEYDRKNKTIKWKYDNRLICDDEGLRFPYPCYIYFQEGFFGVMKVEDTFRLKLKYDATVLNH